MYAQAVGSQTVTLANENERVVRRSLIRELGSRRAGVVSSSSVLAYSSVTWRHEMLDRRDRITGTHTPFHFHIQTFNPSYDAPTESTAPRTLCQRP